MVYQHTSTDPETVLDRDVFKTRMAMINGYTVIRILQEDVWYDKTNWRVLLSEALVRVYECPRVVCIASDNSYCDLLDRLMIE